MNNFSKFYNVINYDCDIKLLHKKSKELQVKIKQERDNFTKANLNMSELFPDSDFSYKFVNLNKVTFSYYYNDESHYFDLIYEFEEDFNEGYFIIKTIQELDLVNINEYSYVLNKINKQLENKETLSNKLSQFIKEQKERKELIDNLQDEIHYTKLSIHLCHKKNEFKLKEIEEIFPLNSNLDLNDLISNEIDKNNFLFKLYTYKFGNKHFELYKNIIKVDKDNNVFSINDKECSLEDINVFIKHSFSYKNKIVNNIRIIKDISPLIFQSNNKSIKISYKAFLNGLEKDLNILKFKNF